MFFWGLHATGKFDEPAIGCGGGGGPIAVSRELQGLVASGVLEKEVRDGKTLYWLTTNEAKRRSIVEWASPGHSGR